MYQILLAWSSIIRRDDPKSRFPLRHPGSPGGTGYYRGIAWGVLSKVTHYFPRNSGGHRVHVSPTAKRGTTGVHRLIAWRHRVFQVSGAR